MSLKTYLVEDDPQLRETLTDSLREFADARVVGFSEEAVEASRWLIDHDGDWDVAIVDLQLARGSGLTVLAACRVRAVHQHAVVFSANATSDLRNRCWQFGADAVFDKATQAPSLLAYCADLPRRSPALHSPAQGGM